MVHETRPACGAIGEPEVDAVHGVVLGALSNGFLPGDDCYCTTAYRRSSDGIILYIYIPGLIETQTEISPIREDHMSAILHPRKAHCILHSVMSNMYSTVPAVSKVVVGLVAKRSTSSASMMPNAQKDPTRESEPPLW